MSTTACARLSEGYAGLAGIVTTRWQRSRASFVRPLSSRPNTRATDPAPARSTISAAAARERRLQRLEPLHPRQDVLRLMRNPLDPVGVVLARVHEAQVAEPEVLQRPHHVRDVDQVLGLVEHDDDAHRVIPPAPGSRADPRPACPPAARPIRRRRSTRAAPRAARGPAAS